MAASTVDVNVPRFNQGAVAVLTAIAFLIQSPALVAITFVVLGVSAVGGPAVVHKALLKDGYEND